MFVCFFLSLLSFLLLSSAYISDFILFKCLDWHAQKLFDGLDDCILPLKSHRQKNRQTDKQMDRQAERWMNRWTD